MKLALGTVQLGMPYGIASKSGQVTEKQASEILECAQKAGITHLDTAIAYGESETVLGNHGVSWAKLITKLPPIPSDLQDINSWVQNHIVSSMERLKISQLEAIMLHKASDLLNHNGDAIYKSLQNLKQAGHVKKIGYSIYSPNDLDELYHSYKPDIIQAPFNLFDRRLEQSNWLERLKSDNVEVHIRSVFLQGLLLMEPKSRPNYFLKWQHNFSAFDNWLKAENITASEACLGFVNGHKQIDKIVVGVDNSNQLKELISLSETKLSQAPALIASTNEDLINPSHWKK